MHLRHVVPEFCHVWPPKGGGVRHQLPFQRGPAERYHQRTIPHVTCESKLQTEFVRPSKRHQANTAACKKSHHMNSRHASWQMACCWLSRTNTLSLLLSLVVPLQCTLTHRKMACLLAETHSQTPRRHSAASWPGPHPVLCGGQQRQPRIRQCPKREQGSREQSTLRSCCQPGCRWASRPAAPAYSRRQRPETLSLVGSPHNARTKRPALSPA